MSSKYFSSRKDPKQASDNTKTAKSISSNIMEGSGEVRAGVSFAEGSKNSVSKGNGSDHADAVGVPGRTSMTNGHGDSKAVEPNKSVETVSRIEEGLSKNNSKSYSNKGNGDIVAATDHDVDAADFRDPNDPKIGRAHV